MIIWPTSEICEAGDCDRKATHNVMVPRYNPYLVWLVCWDHVKVLRGLSSNYRWKCNVWKRGVGQHVAADTDVTSTQQSDGVDYTPISIMASV